MAKLTCHVEKHGRHAIGAIARAIRTDNRAELETVVRPELSFRNRMLLAPPAGDLRKSVFARVAQRANPERAVRKDAVLLCQVTVSAQPPFFDRLDDQRLYAFFDAATQFLRHRYQAENAMFSAVHLDESAPHLHFGFVPMTQDLHLSAKEIVDRVELQRLQAELPDYLKSRGFDVERGGQEPGRSRPEPPSSADPFPPPPTISGERDAGLLQRENQSLKLENLLLERQIKGIIDIIQSEPQLEALYLRQVENQARLKREQHQRRTAVPPHGLPDRG